MKVMLLVMAGFLLLIYLYGLKSYKEVRSVLMKGFMEVEGEKITFQEIIPYSRFLLVMVLCLSQVVWFLTFRHYDRMLGGIGSAISFLDFVLNNEVLGRLAKGPVDEKVAKYLMIGFYTLSIPYIACLGYLGYLLIQLQT